MYTYGETFLALFKAISVVCSELTVRTNTTLTIVMLGIDSSKLERSRTTNNHVSMALRFVQQVVFCIPVGRGHQGSECGVLSKCGLMVCNTGPHERVIRDSVDWY